MGKKLFVFSLATHLFYATSALAESTLSVHSGGGSINPMATSAQLGVAQRTTSSQIIVRMRASCYGTNLRGVGNPVSPSSNIRMTATLTPSGGSAADFSILFPATAVLGGGMSAATAQDLGLLNTSGLPANSQLGVAGNMIVLKIPHTAVASLDPVSATISDTQNAFTISNVRFEQIMPEYASQGAFMGKDGPLSGSYGATKSSDGKLVDIQASFPGENKYCGGFFSPLMVFFDSARPKFDNIVSFDMHTGLKTYWPEKNHPGYFIVLPVKKKVTSKDQLFGEDDKYKNGFLKLAQYDKNKDGVIDARDPIFKKLVLWKDVKGLGIYDAKDSIPLNTKIKSINLNYASQIEAVGTSAELREKSTFELQKNLGAPPEKGDIFDVWFKPAFEK
ncbi:MAG: hypothetical protein H7328_06310 [Bdellovibrio sp.]|nr:hypothetical protein [Bdellovibrio sp.]